MKRPKAHFDQALPRPASRLTGLRPYVAESRAPTIDLRLDANEGAAPSETVCKAFSGITAEELRRYPDASMLESRIAHDLGIDTSRVLVTNGGDDAIDRTCRAVLEPGREMLTHAPGFVMIDRSARLAGGAVQSMEWSDGSFPLDRFVAAISERTSLIALVSPNNPTGSTITTDQILAIVRAGAHVGALVMVDLAYIEFADHDPTDELLTEPNVVVIRTMSKAFGLAGARVGYAIASPEVIEWLRTAGGPYPVSSVSLALGLRAIKHSGEREAFLARVRYERDELVSLMRDLGATPFPSQANFVAVRFGDAGAVHASLASAGILVRAFGTTPGLEDVLRITLPGSNDEFDRLCNALRSALIQRSSP